MLKTSKTIYILTPDEGKYLTQAGELERPTDRFFASEIQLGYNDSEDNYKEITREEVDALLKEIEELNNVHEEPETVAEETAE